MFYRSIILTFHLILIASLIPATPTIAGGLVSTDMEVEIGRAVRDDVLGEYDLWNDSADNNLVADITAILVPIAETRQIDYEFYIIVDDAINAFAAPGGFIFVTTGLLDFLGRDPAMLSGILAHEISHVSRRHHKDSIEDALYGTLGIGILFGALGLDDDWQEIAVQVVFTLIAQGHTRENEYDADKHAVLFSYRAGWDPNLGIIQSLRALESEFGSGNPLGDIGRYIASHPDTDRRVYFAEIELDEIRATEPFNPRPLPGAGIDDTDDGIDEDSDDTEREWRKPPIR